MVRVHYRPCKRVNPIGVGPLVFVEGYGLKRELAAGASSDSVLPLKAFSAVKDGYGHHVKNFVGWLGNRPITYETIREYLIDLKASDTLWDLREP
jgi:hypothetical protein